MNCSRQAGAQPGVVHGGLQRLDCALSSQQRTLAGLQGQSLGSLELVLFAVLDRPVPSHILVDEASSRQAECRALKLRFREVLGIRRLVALKSDTR